MRRAGAGLRLAGLIAALAGAMGLAWFASQPPRPLPADARPERFSAARAMTDIRRIAQAPHPTGSAEDAQVRAYLAARLRSLGLDVETQSAPLSPRAQRRLAGWIGPAAAGALAANVIGIMPGRDRAAPAVLLMAHHDTVAGSPGAADDSAGVAAILESLRAIRAGPPPARDLIVLFTDAEELNSDGAAAFFRTHPLAHRIGVVVNLEARGGGGRALMFETGPGDGPMMRLFAKAVRGPSANSAAVLVYRLLPNVTDFSIPKAAGLAGFNFAFLGRAGLYHAAQATPDAIDPGSVQHIGAQTLDLARALASAPALPARGEDSVFSDILGFGLIDYPAMGGWGVLAASAGLLAVAGRRARNAGLLTARGAIAGAAAGLGLTLVLAGLLALANQISGPGAGYYDRLAALPRLELQAVLISLGGFCLAAVGGRAEAGRWSSWLGLATFLLAISAAVQAVAPGAAPIFAWPLLIVAAAAAIASLIDRSFGAPVVILSTAWLAAIAAGYVLGLAHLAFVGIGPDLPAAMAVFALPVALAVWPLLRGAGSRRVAAGLGIALLIAGFGVALSTRLAPPAATIPAYARAAR